MSRIVVLELLQALKFKTPVPDTNLLLLVQVKMMSFIPVYLHLNYKSKTFFGCCQFVCADIGTRLAESTIIQKHMISTLPVVRLESLCGTILLRSVS